MEKLEDQSPQTKEEIRLCLDLLKSEVKYARQVAAILLGNHDFKGVTLALGYAWASEDDPVVQRFIEYSLKRHSSLIARNFLANIGGPDKDDGIIDLRQTQEIH